ncbi:MAG: hypothetical protein QGD90_00050 [Candidatus Hydrogenedentes bacterium]|nr:hypothetical protein [Candidatus Hydrogenedentota bacterium]
MRDFDTLCEALAAVLTYPERDYAERVLRYRDMAAVEAPAVVEQAEAFMASIEGKSLSELEERYIQTFDLNPLCSLDTGWQLFGEEYNRGLYMVKIRNEMRRLKIPETTELPDHLTNVLRVLGRMSEEDAISFAVCCLVPAVDKILGAVKKGNPYRPLIQGIANLLEARYGRYIEEAAEEDPPDYSGVFALKEANHE